MARKEVDWDGMEPEWRAGIISKLQLSEKYCVSRAAIDKHWDKLGVERDLTAKIRQAADALVTSDAVAVAGDQVTARPEVDEGAVVRANAELQANVIRGQRKDVMRYRTLCQTLVAELESESNDPNVFHELGELLKSGDASTDKLNEAYRKAISLPQRIDGIKKLAETLKTLIGLERQAFGIADNAEGETKKEEGQESMIELARKVAFTVALGLKSAQNQ
jgi:hypothetical protein